MSKNVTLVKSTNIQGKPHIQHYWQGLRSQTQDKWLIEEATYLAGQVFYTSPMYKSKKTGKQRKDVYSMWSLFKDGKRY